MAEEAGRSKSFDTGYKYFDLKSPSKAKLQ